MNVEKLMLLIIIGMIVLVSAASILAVSAQQLTLQAEVINQFDDLKDVPIPQLIQEVGERAIR